MPKPNTYVDPNNCMHQYQSSVFMNSNGKLNYCCFFGRKGSVNNVEELLYNKVDLTRETCIKECGS